jgi:hypothetical protein
MSKNAWKNGPENAKDGPRPTVVNGRNASGLASAASDECLLYVTLSISFLDTLVDKWADRCLHFFAANWENSEREKRRI